jgi:hypothetical protein
MEATITAIDQVGVWNEMDKKLVTVSTGEQYTFFVKQNTPFPHAIGERITFEVTNEKYKNAKLTKTKSYSGSYSKPQDNGFSKDELIIRQTVIKSSCELHASDQNVDRVLEDAEILYNWIRYGK